MAGFIVDSYGYTDRKAEQKKGLGLFVKGKDTFVSPVIVSPLLRIAWLVQDSV